MAWRLVEVSDQDATDQDLTDGELIGISIMIYHNTAPEDRDDLDVYWMARSKIQPQVIKALRRRFG